MKRLCIKTHTQQLWGWGWGFNLLSPSSLATQSIIIFVISFQILKACPNPQTQLLTASDWPLEISSLFPFSFPTCQSYRNHLRVQTLWPGELREHLYSHLKKSCHEVNDPWKFKWLGSLNLWNYLVVRVTLYWLMHLFSHSVDTPHPPHTNFTVVKRKKKFCQPQMLAKWSIRL